ncbi:Cdc6/Cdc18 family protein [Natrinema longum]|uniref:Orc1/cdc6 family replication initiation protein n=1 Tax=Natrinema longum TaxID=370324 RepID=A0A8A2UC39_9EURY|nr:Cdc6/Cdc18 family protein [Natrinema longum]MBZ6495647.1 orc1/cdc6 family replication initiation protein [Natrinema longum]QSW86391.1 orc1/cdc6 family replication initiation protein [Natrinema longum]
MISDARALRPSHIPSDLYHRDAKIEQLADALRPIADGDTGENVLIFGPSGTGKTTLARFVVRELEHETLDFRWGYHNCISGSSKAEVLYGVMRDADLGADLKKIGSPTSAFIDRLRESDKRIVAIVDEVDVIEDDTTLQALIDIPNVTIVAITIDEDDLFAHLDSRVRSRLRSAETITLDRFTHAQLVDILQARIRAGLRPGTISTDAIGYIADVAAGDAREAIGILRSSARAVSRDCDRSQITIDIVDEVRAAALEEIHLERVEDLGTHKRLLYDIIEVSGTIPGSELHDTYEQRAQNPKAKSTRRRYLSNLEEKYGLIESNGSGRGKTYAVPDF